MWDKSVFFFLLLSKLMNGGGKIQSAMHGVMAH